jgi:hypothetical protein
MKLVRVQRRHDSHWHWVLESELRPFCSCGCRGPNAPNKKGDTLCICPCHELGPRYAFSLCEKERYPDAPNATWIASYRHPCGKTLGDLRLPWHRVKGARRGCQRCAQIGANLTRLDVQTQISLLEAS